MWTCLWENYRKAPQMLPKLCLICAVIMGFSALRSFKFKAYLQFVYQADMFSEHFTGKYFLSKEYSAQRCNAAFGPQNPSFEDAWQSYVIWEQKNVYSVVQHTTGDQITFPIYLNVQLKCYFEVLIKISELYTEMFCWLRNSWCKA